MDYPQIPVMPRLHRLRAWRGRVFLAVLWFCGRGLRALGLKRVHRLVMVRLVERTGLFDPAFYLTQNEDVAAAHLDPVTHYVAHGSRERRAPCPLFDPSHYRGQAKARLAGVNTLLHYAWVGRHLGHSPSAWFDLPYYLAHNKDVARAGVDPLRHYLLHGRLEGRLPSPQVAPYPFPLAASATPWQLPADVIAHAATVPLKRSGAVATRVDVIVPVFRGFSETVRCLESVLRAPTQIPFELIVIDDCGPDETLTDWLTHQAEQGAFTLLRNASNLGFVASANRGMCLHPARDKVLLNADTEVHGDWLDRLHAHAHAVPRCGTVTPLTNNGTICSYPVSLRENPYPLELTWAELDGLAAQVNAGVWVEAPTGVGFCLYVTAACVDSTGPFDVARFGHGYGEENDFCQRARNRGWLNILAADVFVHHVGSVSFQGTRGPRVQRAMKILNDQHPGYDRQIRQFIALDPLLTARRNLDWARLRRHRRAENVLVFCHRRGGGSERHLNEDVTALSSVGIGVFFLRPDSHRKGHLRWSTPGQASFPNLGAQAFAETQVLAAAVRDLHITRIHVHGLVDFGDNATAQLQELVDATGLPLWVDIHDYAIICPEINLVDDSGIYCGEPDETACRRCLGSGRNPFGVRDIVAWRQSQHALLQRAARILVPDEDVAARLSPYFPDLVFEVSPHEDPESFREQPRTFLPDAQRPLHVVVPGAIGRIKGFEVLLTCARDARRRGLPIRFTVLGYTLDDSRLQREGVVVTGRYLEHEALQRLADLDADVAWIPSVWPETYSYTLSLALGAGLPVFAFDLGAVAARLRRLNRADHLMPLSLAARPMEISARFCAFRDQTAPVGR
jgi:GT2 family glycosyltransferase